MRSATIMAGLVAAVMLSGPAAAFDEPKPLVQAIYDSYRAGEAVPDLTPFYSQRLKAIFEAYYEEQRAEVAPEAPTPFDPFVGGDNPLLFDLKIGEPMVLGERAVVDVSFNNFDHPSLLSLALTKEEDGWKVDDVTSHGGEEPWLLSWLLQYDPLSY